MLAEHELRPAISVEASTPADVRSAVLAARSHDLPLTVYATGHGTLTPAAGSLVLKTGRMDEVLVDPRRRVARVGAGARWRDVIAAAAPFGLAPLSGTSPDVGVTGYTLGGGYGWLSRMHGFAADSVVRAEVVTASGSLLSASAERNADLFWALRGGGANFGVVTALEFRLYPVASVYGGLALFDAERAADVLAFYRDWAPAQPDELTTSIVVTRDALAIRGLYAGGREAARRALRPLWVAAGGAPHADLWHTMRYAEAGGIGGTAPRGFERLDALSDAAIAAIAGSGAEAVDVRHWGGAMARPSGGAGPIGHRDVPFSVTTDGGPEQVAAIARHATGGSFLNFLKDPSRTRAAYTAGDYARLTELKRAYDPHNLLGTGGHNISPGLYDSPASSLLTAA